MSLLEKFHRRIFWQRVPIDEFRIDDPRKELWLILGYCIFFVLASVIIGLMIREFPIPLFGAASLTDDFWYVVLFKIVLLLSVPLLWFHYKGYRLNDLMPGWRFGPKAVLAIAFSQIAGMSLNLLQGHFSRIGDAYGDFSTNGFVFRIVFGILVALVQAGFPEEFVFRGMLQTRIEKNWGRVPAIGLTVVLFVAWHIPTRFFNSSGVEGSAGDLLSVLLGTGVPVMIVAIIFGLIWDRYRCFLPLVAAHWGVDILPSVLSYLGISY